jgi:hypothetical protein
MLSVRHDAKRERHRLRGRGAFVEQRRIGHRQPVRSATMVWKLSSASSRPWAISGWYGV